MTGFVSLLRITVSVPVMSQETDVLPALRSVSDTQAGHRLSCMLRKAAHGNWSEHRSSRLTWFWYTTGVMSVTFPGRMLSVKGVSITVTGGVETVTICCCV